MADKEGSGPQHQPRSAWVKGKATGSKDNPVPKWVKGKESGSQFDQSKNTKNKAKY